MEALRNGAVALARGFLDGLDRVGFAGAAEEGRIQLPMLRHVKVNPPRDLVRVAVAGVALLMALLRGVVSAWACHVTNRGERGAT